MSTPKSSGGRRSVRAGKNQHVTKSGKTIKLNRSLGERLLASRSAKANRKASRLANLPKGRLKRFLYHFEPKRMYHYWFSRDGAIMALKITGVGFVVGFMLLVGLFAYFRKDLPNLRDISGNNIGGSIRYYDRSGQTLLWQDYDAVKRIPVQDKDISKYLKDATVAVEDKDFFKHGGFDVRGITRAGINNLLGKSGTQGGSTITQQLVKLTQNWTKDRSYTRKAKELILSVELERSYSKNEILAGYLNTAPYGNVQYGAEAAARDYFQKSAKDLTLDESVFMAAIPKSPSFYSPYGAYYKDNTKESQQALVGRMQYILNLMQQQGMITAKQHDEAKKIDVLAKVKEPQGKYSGIKAPWFVLTAKKQLENKYGADTVNRGGWSVTTTLDMNLQNKAEELVAQNLPKIMRYGADTEAMVGEDVQTGQIVSLVGGTDFTKNQNNYASGILIPPGSSFKPYDYTTLIDNNTNVGAGSVLYDQQTPLPGYPCTNKATRGGNCLQDYDFLQPGPLTLRYALGGSRNIPAVKAMLSAVPNDKSAGRVDSINKVLSTATAMMDNPSVKGYTYNCYADEALTQTSQCYGASAIGDGAFLHLDDHVNGLSTLARLGSAIPRTYILKITDSSNKVISQWTQPKGKQVIKADSAYIMDDMASDPNASYLPGSCTATTCSPLSRGGYKFHRYNGWKFAVKTGTTNDGYDGLMTSWSPKYAVVSWVGHNTRHVTLSTSMEILTAPLTRGWMEAAHEGQTPVAWTAPSGIKSLPAFVVRNHIHFGDIEPSPTNDLFPSWYQAKSGANSNQPIDKVSHKLATECTPDLAKDTSGSSNAASWNIDIFNGGSLSGGSSSSTIDKDDVHKCGEAHPAIGLTITSSGNTYNLSVDVTEGAHPITSDKFVGKVNYILDGQTIQSFDITGPGTGLASFSYTPDFVGTKNIYAQVIDSVLYDGTSETGTITGSPVSESTFSVVATNPSGNNYSFVWSTGGTGTITIYKSGGTEICHDLATNTGCSKVVGGGISGWYAKDSSGKVGTVSGP